MIEEKVIGRRSFLKTAGTIGAALAFSPTVNRLSAYEGVLNDRKEARRNGDSMECRTLGSGNASMKVSAIGFGCMGMNYNRSQSPDRKECIRVIHEAVDCGVTLFDTAIIYGPLRNELLVGEALAPYRGRVNITTKFGHEVVDGKSTGRQDSSRDTVRRYCEESLRRLQLESIPLFYQHRYDRNTPIEYVAETISELIKEGKVQRWGLAR